MVLVLDRTVGNGLVVLERRTLDGIFNDLAQHIIDNSLGAEGLEQVIAAVGIPKELPNDVGRFRNFVFQASVKFPILTFPMQTNYSLQQARFKEGYLEARGQYYTTDDWGTMVVIEHNGKNSSKYKYNHRPISSKTVINGLYEFADDSGYNIPIILVASLNHKPNEEEQREKKRPFVKALYGTSPYFFEVRRKRELPGLDTIGLHTLQQDYRRLIVPYNGQLDCLAKNLFDKTYGRY